MKKLGIAVCILLAYIWISVYFDFALGLFLLWLAVVCVFCGFIAIIVMPLPNYYDNPNED